MMCIGNFTKDGVDSHHLLFFVAIGPRINLSDLRSFLQYEYWKLRQKQLSI